MSESKYLFKGFFIFLDANNNNHFFKCKMRFRSKELCYYEVTDTLRPKRPLVPPSIAKFQKNIFNVYNDINDPSNPIFPR